MAAAGRGAAPIERVIVQQHLHIVDQVGAIAVASGARTSTVSARRPMAAEGGVVMIDAGALESR